MRPLLLVFIIALCPWVKSQTTNVPDSNFEQALIDFGYDTGLQRPYNMGFRVQGTEGLWQDYEQVNIPGTMVDKPEFL